MGATLGPMRWIAHALLIASGISAVLAISQFIKARRAPYYVLRRDALRRATRLSLVSVVTLILAAILFTVVPRLQSTSPGPTPTAPPPTATPESVPTPVPLPTTTLEPSTTPTRRPTATPPTIPTPTPAVFPPDAVLQPLPSAVPAGPDARIELQSLALERGADGLPVNPGNQFPPGDHRVYLFFRWEGMADGNATTFAWYQDGELIEFCSDTWLWGLVEGRDWGERGRTSYYCRLPGGWSPGQYEIHVFIEDQLQGIAQFAITEQ